MAANEALLKVANSGDVLVQHADGLTQDTFKICKEFLRPFKRSLRKLNLNNDFPVARRLSSIRKNLTILGDHIDVFLLHYCKKWEIRHWKKMLWRFVSLFSAFDEKQLCKMYRYSKTNQTAKFLKAFDCTEGADLAVSLDPGDLMKLHQKWQFQTSKKMEEKLHAGCLLPPSHGPHTGSVHEARKEAEGKWLCEPHAWAHQEDILDSYHPLGHPRSYDLAFSAATPDFQED